MCILSFFFRWLNYILPPPGPQQHIPQLLHRHCYLLLQDGGGADGHLLKVTRWLSTSYNLTSKNPNYPFRATSLCFRFVNADADVSLFTQMDLKCSRTILKITPRHWALHLHTVMYFPTHPFSHSSPFRSRRKLQHQDLLSAGTFLSEVLLQTTAE